MALACVNGECPWESDKTLKAKVGEERVASEVNPESGVPRWFSDVQFLRRSSTPEPEEERLSHGRPEA